MDFINKVFQGDNLKLMKKIPPECVDLIYIDPPFMTQVEWKSEVGSFNDKFDNLEDFIAFLKPRLSECRRVLKGTGSLMVHFDWRTVHYVKVLLDEIFGYERLVNEIIWKRSSFLTTCPSQFIRNHDTILWYSKTSKKTFVKVCRDTKAKRRRFNDGDGKGDFFYTSTNGKFKQITNGPKECTLVKTKKGYKRKVYFNKLRTGGGVALDSVWYDIPKSGNDKDVTLHGKYPTQKPERLLERIIRSCSRKGDLVADFFCGSGTTLAVAKKNERNYLGCDVSADAVELTEKRLKGITLT